MDRPKQKGKKEKPAKYVDKDKSPSFIADVKTLKENLKIREILRTVKMNSSMRIKAPRGSKVMQSKDFQVEEDLFEDNSEESQLSDNPSATNTHIVSHVTQGETSEYDSGTNEETQVDSTDSAQEDVEEEKHEEANVLHKSKSLSEGLEDTGRDASTSSQSPAVLPLESPLLRIRDRKLSLDHTMLSKREGLSQSAVDLHSIGKSPLERKSSFFRKKMDSFLKNTTEIFKKQTSKVQRKSSTCSRMSVSMQSLNENEVYNGDYDTESQDKYNDEVRGSLTSLRSNTPVRSNSSVSVTRSERLPPGRSDSSLASKPALDGSQPLDHMSSSIHSLSESYVQDSFLHSRAISMSSGLDTAHGPRKRKTSRSNRVTWVASESLTDYFRRLIQDEKSKEIQPCHSYQDFSTIPENTLSGSPKTDSKGRRLSYQRAVSGVDPVYQRDNDASLRRRKITETVEGNSELSACLAEYSRSGVPPLKGFQILSITPESLVYLLWAEAEKNIETHYDWKSLSQTEQARQAVIKELIHTESEYIRHLITIVEVYIAAAHALQDDNKMLELDTSRLFLNIPDVLNANMKFWEIVISPMVNEAFVKNTFFNPDHMAEGFAKFADVMKPYEKYVCGQAKAVDYLRAMVQKPDFNTYLTWCLSKNANRLQLADMLVKPMQRLTKYSLIIKRIANYTEKDESKAVLAKIEITAISFVQGVNRALRRREEMDKVVDVEKVLESYDIEFRDEELDRYFHMLNEINLRTPMVNCGPDNSRAVIYQGDLRYKDHMKEADVRVFLFTDIMLVCKKQTKGGAITYKMIRPKFLLERTIPFARFNSRANPLEVTGLIYVVVDEHGTAVSAFSLSESSKDPQQSLKVWDQKIREAHFVYELSVWFYHNPVKDLAEIEAEYNSENFKRDYPEEWAIERRSRELVAAMLHPYRRPSPSQDGSTRSDSSEPGRGPPSLRYLLHRASTGSSRLSSFQQQSTSSRNSRLSSFQQSASAASYDDFPNLKHLYKAGSSIEHLIPPQNPDDVARSITVNVVSESECETLVPSRQTTPPVLVLQQSSPHHSAGPRSASAGGNHTGNTLRVSPQHSVTMVHSLPDLSIDQAHVKPSPPPMQQSASEKLYQSHQELLQRNRLAASQQHFLSPDHRGTSYPPPSPTRASLKRGLAFSYSFKNPPLSKMGHVNSQSHVNITDQSQPSTSQIKVPVVSQLSQEPGSSADKSEKKKQLSRSKAGAKASSPENLDKSDKGNKKSVKSKSDEGIDSRGLNTKDDDKDDIWSFKAKKDDDKGSRKSFKVSNEDKNGTCSLRSKGDDENGSRKSFRTSDDDKDGRWSFRSTSKCDDDKFSKKSFKDKNDGKKSPKSKSDKSNTTMKGDKHKDRDTSEW